jgi:stearoyl-CoA desaturase (delta-9 desaturase)
MAPHGHKWWEFDVTYNVIRLMKLTGLAWNVVDYKQKTLGGEQQ